MGRCGSWKDYLTPFSCPLIPQRSGSLHRREEHSPALVELIYMEFAASLRGEKVAQIIQLGMAYAPEPPFQSGTPESAPPCVLAEAQRSGEMLAARRMETARRMAARLGINEAPGK